MKNRQDLAKYFADLGFTLGVEVGVDAGKYSKDLCKANPNLQLYCVDIWERKEGKYEVAEKLLEPYSATLVRKPSLEAVKDFDGIDFVYIDAAHDFDNVMRDIIEWGARVRKGGIIAGHDYANNLRQGVEDAVNVYAKHHRLELHLLEEPNKIWTPKHPNEGGRLTGISWWIQK